MADRMPEQIVQRAYLDGMNHRDMVVIKELFAPDYVCHFPAGQGEVRGREAFIETLSAFLGAFDHLVFTVDDVFSDGEKVVLRWSAVGRHTGDYAGIPPTRVIPATGRTVSFSATDIYRVADGQIAEEWNTFDGYHVLDQMDALTGTD
jgi:steroid delta-isomerase-like uncharacterized protein